MSVKDSVNLFYTQCQSGLVVSGNSYVYVAKSITSGDTLASFRVSGATSYIAFRLSKTESEPMVGGTFIGITDYVETEIYVRRTYSAGVDTIPIVSGLSQLVTDFATTVLSGNWNASGNVSRPTLVARSAPLVHEKFGKQRLTYRLRYLA